MSSLGNWWTRIATVVTTATLAIFIPAAAWAAQTGVSDLAYEAARRRSRGVGGFGLFAGLCCLAVVVIVVLAVVMISRGRRNKRR